MRGSETTLFSFGYFGWGNHTDQLVEAVDAVEAKRGYKPPLFVDIRLHRSVRAAGFRDAAFEELVGPKRYRWMPWLGNKRVKSKTGPKIQIAEPERAGELLDLAIESDRRGQRVIFFCGCSFPRRDGKPSCHRSVVADLVLREARRRGVQAEVVEWPGGDPKHIDLEVGRREFTLLRRGAMKIPLPDRPILSEVAATPWCSTATLSTGREKLHRLVGPAKSSRGRWALPVAYLYYDPDTTLGVYERRAAKLRKGWGFLPVRAK